MTWKEAHRIYTPQIKIIGKVVCWIIGHGKIERNVPIDLYCGASKKRVCGQCKRCGAWKTQLFY
jgi:hypothetical protein